MRRGHAFGYHPLSHSSAHSEHISQGHCQTWRDEAASLLTRICITSLVVKGLNGYPMSLLHCSFDILKSEYLMISSFTDKSPGFVCSYLKPNRPQLSNDKCTCEVSAPPSDYLRWELKRLGWLRTGPAEQVLQTRWPLDQCLLYGAWKASRLI